ncbi:MAG: Dabb family protein [Phycisphaerales bacterium]|nr:Dabb family protein [Phycisphaerales bacterium]
MRRSPNPILGLSLALLTGGCQGTRPPRPSLISHIVLISLRDPADAPAALSDCNTLLADIHSIETFACGGPMEGGRDMVVGDYDVGLVIGFASSEDYKAYLLDPIHLQLLEKWKPRVAHMRIFDIVDPTP